nr:unnamed protein product [Digitaria exilis]
MPCRRGPTRGKLQVPLTLAAELAYVCLRAGRCEAGHRLCRGEGGCRRCGLDTTFVHCGPDLDEYAAGFTAPCPFEAYGSASAVVYHTAAAHRDASASVSGPVDRLLVVDGDERRLFVMSVRPRGASCCAVTVACVRASGAADAGPRYWCYLTAYGPVASGVPGDCRYLAAMANVASCSVPGGAAGEEGMHGAGRCFTLM